MRPAAVLVLAGLAIAALGCDTLGIGPQICDRSKENNVPQLYSEGTVEDGIYMSSTWDGDLLYFPGGMRYRIQHKLGKRPRLVQLYLSFDNKGTETGVVSQAAGNQAEIRCADDEAIIVANGSCVEYWLLVVAGVAGDGDAGAPEGDGGAPEGDAGAPEGDGGSAAMEKCVDDEPEP